MKLTAEREKLLAPLQAVIGVVERRQTMPVLDNVLLGVRQGQLSITATDLEVELVASTEVAVQEAGDITVPGRKLLDILRALPEKLSVSLSVEGDKVVIKAGRSRFSLSSLPASEFPVIDDINAQQKVHGDCSRSRIGSGVRGECAAERGHHRAGPKAARHS